MITNTLMITITLLKLADSLIPITNKTVIAATMNIAGKLSTAVICGKLAARTPDAARLFTS